MTLETSSNAAMQGAPIEDLSFWHKHYQQCQASTFNRKAYCRQHQLNYNRFQYWYRKLNMTNNSTPVSTAPLIPVKLSSAALKNTPICQLNTAEGHQLLIYDLRELKGLLERLL